MKWVLFILLFIGALGGGVYYVSLTPLREYNKIGKTSQYNKYFRLQTDARKLLYPSRIPVKRNFYSGKGSRLWKKFNLKHFVIPIPFGHPQFKVIPIIERKDGFDGPLLGFNINTPSGELLLNFQELPPIKFDRDLNSQEIFKLPIFQEYLRSMKAREIWQDIYSKKIVMRKEEKNPLKVDYNSMVYDLYILNLRSNLLPDGFDKFTYDEVNNRSIVRLKSKDPNYHEEIIGIWVHGVVHLYRIKSHAADIDGIDMRSQIIAKVKLETLGSEAARIVYREFKGMPYRDQKGEKGMIYLFSAWSQDLGNKGFLREMIQFLEKGENNFKKLQSLYNYALFKYKTSFSKNDELEGEDPNLKIERRSNLELEQELEDVRRSAASIRDDFQSDEDKINYYLQMAKEKGDNIDEDENVLTVD